MSQVPTPAELFGERVPRALAAHPDKAREVDAVFRFKITGEGGGDWTVDLTSDPPICTEGEGGAAAECTIEVSVDDFREMLTDSGAGMRLYLEDKLKIEGDAAAAKRLPLFFESVSAQ
jgi:hypothetical protein